MHGKDFTTAGAEVHLDGFESELEVVCELSKGGRFGPGQKDDTEGLILNRVVRWTEKG